MYEFIQFVMPKCVRYCQILQSSKDLQHDISAKKIFSEVFLNLLALGSYITVIRHDLATKKLSNF